MTKRAWTWLTGAALVFVTLIAVAGEIDIPGVKEIIHNHKDATGAKCADGDEAACRELCIQLSRVANFECIRPSIASPFTGGLTEGGGSGGPPDQPGPPGGGSNGSPPSPPKPDPPTPPEEPPLLRVCVPPIEPLPPLEPRCIEVRRNG
jgi:hypothetical protein